MMASAQYAVDGTAIKISATSQTPRHVYIHPASGNIYINGANTVTTTNGLFIDSGSGVVMIQMDADDELWAVASGGTHTVTVLERYL